MIRYVHQSLKFAKHLSALCSGGKKPAIIAQKAESLLRLLRNQGYLRPDQLGTTKRYVDRRIKNCTKHDLGSGYRLITVTENNHLFVMYVGTHDDCCRWIENNKEFDPSLVKHRCITYAVDVSKKRPRDVVPAPIHQHEDGEEDPLKNIDDNVLRRIFCGLLKKTT